jgi:hypothetical protein
MDFRLSSNIGEFPDAPASLRASIEVDVQPKNRPETVDMIDGALGELSMFHETHGFYVHGISIDSAMLPEGWQQRAVAINDPVPRPAKQVYVLRHTILPPASSQPIGRKTKNSSASS